MSSSHYNYHPFHSIGPARLSLWDASALDGAGAWDCLGRVADCALIISGELTGKEVISQGAAQPIARRPRSRRYSLSFRLLEDAGPQSLGLLFSDGAAQSAAAAGIAVAAELVRLYGSEQAQLGHPWGICAEVPGPVTGLSISTGGSGGVIATSSPHYWVVPYLAYGGSAVFFGQPAHAGQASITAGQQVTIDFTPPAGYSPDGYHVYYNSTNTLSGALLAAVGTGHPIVFGSHLGSPAYSAQTAPLLTLLTPSGDASYSATDDYSFDAAQGTLARSAGSALASGQQALALYAWRTSSAVATPLGRMAAPERYARVKLAQLAPQDPDGAGLGAGGLDPLAWRETGLEFEFYRAALAPAESRLSFSEDDFSAGALFSWDLMHDGAAGLVGTARSNFGVLAQWT